MAEQVGSAFIAVRPDFRGFQKQARRQMPTVLATAGRDGGRAAGRGIVTGVGQETKRGLPAAVTPAASEAGAEAGRQGARSFVTGFGRSIRGSGSRISAAIAAPFAAAGLSVKTALAGVVAAAGGVGVNAAAQFEQAQATMTGLLGSAKAARQEIAAIRRIGSRSPINTQALLEAGNALAYLGVQGNEAVSIIRNMTTAAIASGNGTEGISRMTLALNVLSSQGKATADVLNQISAAGFPIWSELAAASSQSVAQVREDVTEGKVSVEDVMSSIEQTQSDTFKQMRSAEKETADTLINTWRQARDNVVQSLGQMATPLNDVLKPAIKSVGEALSSAFQSAPSLFSRIGDALGGGEGGGQLSQTFSALQRFGKQLLPVIQGIGSRISKVLGPAFRQIGTLFQEQLLPAFRAFLPAVAPIAKFLLGIFGDILITTLRAVVSVVKGVVKVIAGIFNVFAGLLTGDWSRLWMGLKQIVGGLLEAIWGLIRLILISKIGAVFKIARKLFGGLWKRIWDPISKFFTRIATGIFNAVRGWLDDIALRVLSFGDRVKRVWSNFWGAIRSSADRQISTIRRGIRRGLDFIRRTFRRVVDGISRIWNGLQNAAKKPVNFIINTVFNRGIRGLWNRVNDLWGGTDIPRIPALAAGDVVPAQPMMTNKPTAIVGEGGRHPEYVIPTDPKYRSRAVGLWEQAGGQLMESGGVLGALKRAGNWALDLFTNPVKTFTSLGQNVINGLVGALPLPDTGFAQGVSQIPGEIVENLAQAVKKQSGGAGYRRGLSFARANNGLPYQWGGVGNPSFDCSGYTGSIAAAILGQPTQQRYFTTHSFTRNHGPMGFVRGLQSPYMVGVTHSGVGHMAGTLLGVNVESSGSGGVRVGNGARGANNSLFSTVYGLKFGGGRKDIEPPGGEGANFDQGGFLPPGVSTVANFTGRPEPVLSSAQWSSLTDAADRGGNVTYSAQVYPQQVSLDEQGLLHTMHVAELRARIGRER